MTPDVNLNKLLVGFIDLLLFAGSYILAYYIRFGAVSLKHLTEWSYLLSAFVFIFMLLFAVYGLYSQYIKFDEVMLSMLCALVITTIIVLAMSFLFRMFSMPRSIFVIALLLQFILLASWRFLVRNKGLLIRKPQNAIIIGYPSEINRLSGSINGSLERGLKIIQQLKINSKSHFLERWETFAHSSAAADVDVIIACSSLNQEDRRTIFNYAITHGKTVMLVPGICDILLSKTRLVSAGDVPIIELQGLSVPALTRGIKRVMDMTLSSIALLILLLPSLLIALTIKIDSPGPVFYSQERLGLDNKTFRLFKFRTMVQNAEALTGPVLATEYDSRITRVGNVLRKIRADEIPQFWNVLKGDMSLVGPRPERPYFVEEFQSIIPEFGYRHLIKGGITGLAQVEGRYSTEPSNKLHYDLMYAQNSSIAMDFVILLRTAKVLLQRNKAS